MDFINATWDTRNLGVKTAEVVFTDSDDAIDAAAFADATRPFGYIAAKVPPTNPHALRFLQTEGFSFVECSINFVFDLTEIDDLKRLLATRQISVRPAQSPADIAFVLDRIGEGLFDTDRVYLDPAFGPALAAARYVHWIEDELDRGAELFDVCHGEKRVGFFAYKEPEPGVSYPFLIGLYPEYRGRHFGKALLAASLVLSAERGCTRSSTWVSSNNPSVIRCHEAIGSRIDKLHYVLVKHQTPKD